jgi:antirestriction protein ArdC
MTQRPCQSDEQCRTEQRALATASIEQLRSSTGWRSWLRARHTFHSYSLGNQLLILHQHPTATRVAGFGAWLKLGYSVRRGEHGIRIWAPCPPSKQQLAAWRRAGADPDERPRTFWKLAAVFDRSQVQELPPPAVPAPLDPPIAELAGDDHGHLFAPLTALAAEIGFTVTIDGTPRGDGVCQPKTRRIVIADRLEPNARVATLVHELGHAILAGEDAELSYAEEELVVESIVVCVAQTIGLDTAENSIPYLASWAEAASVEVLERTAQLTDRLGRRIEDHLLAHNDDGDPDDTPAAAAAIA